MAQTTDLLKQRFKRLRRGNDVDKGRARILKDRIEINDEDIAERLVLVDNIEKAIEVVQVVTETRRQQLRDRVESLVTKGLRAVFGNDDFEFKFNVKINNHTFGVVPVLVSKFNGNKFETPILDGHGGGVADLVSFLLRVVVLSLASPRIAPILILDESFRHISPEYLRGVGVLLKELSESVGIQFVIVTHKDELLDSADVIYRSSLDKNKATQFILQHNLKDELYHSKPKRQLEVEDRSTMFDHEEHLTVTKEDVSKQKRYPKKRRRKRRSKK